MNPDQAGRLTKAVARVRTDLKAAGKDCDEATRRFKDTWGKSLDTVLKDKNDRALSAAYEKFTASLRTIHADLAKAQDALAALEAAAKASRS